MNQPLIAPAVRRFVLTSIPSVPHLEALLLLRNEQAESWTSARLAQRLYLSEKSALVLLVELTSVGVVTGTEAQVEYRYHPHSEELRGLVDQLAEAYARHLVEVTHLIHSKTDRKAHQFADAFKLRKD
jgi:hypothetical protein